MKRLSLFVALLLMVAMPMMAERVTPETAQKVAKTFLNNNGAKSAQLTDLTNAAGFPNLYIFNGKEGFVVMAADDCVQPILGYSLTGKFVTENMPTNVKGWLEGYNDEIQYAIDSKMKASTETSKLWKDLIEGNTKAAKATTVVSALLQTTWDQNGYYYYSGGQLLIYELYNNLCPYDNNAGERTVTGCVATAMAQIMKYWSYPAYGVGSHSYTPETHPEYGVQSANFATTNYAWSNMPNELTSSSTTTQKNAIATLMYHCGVSVDMDYDISNNGGSGAYSEDVPYALINYFNYKSTASIKYKSNYTDNNWINLLKTELNASRPIQYSGSGTGGHAFVCDGYNSNNYFHFNWGWSGSNDGFYLLSSLNPGSGGSGGGNYNFTNSQKAIIGIEPASNIASPTNLSYTLSGTQNITLTWNAVSAAVSYNVYRNGSLIGNASGTTFSETAPYGSNSYYVRAVDANGQQSLPSNTVTIYIEYATPVVTNLTATLSGSNVNLSWTAPAWCYPPSPSATLTYGDGTFYGRIGFGDGSNMYWGHRYPASSLTSYNSMSIYKAAFYAYETGAYKIFIYKGTTSNRPQTKVIEQSINVGSTGWYEFDLTTRLIIDASKDYWIFIYDPQGRDYPATYSSYSGSEGDYYSSAPTSWVGNGGNMAFLIRAYITDGIYTYDLWDNSTKIADNIANTIYTVSNVASNVLHQYYVKTNYYGGDSDASNKVGIVKGTVSVSSLSLGTNDKLTITAGSKLTVTGTLSNSVASNLIIENGAQLVNNSNGVKATVIKNISAYTRDQSKGWHLIASPITESITQSSGNGLFSNTYDLYSYNQSEELQWRNIKAQSFALSNKGGYLYANSGNPTISYSGTLVGNTSATPLSYNANVTGKGFNLIGNPYPCNANVNRSFYVLNADGSDFILGSNPVPPCAAILVQAQGANQSVTFSKASSKSSPSLTLSVIQAETNTILDKARINFGSDESLEKYTMREDNAKLFIPQNGQDLAVASANGTNEMPISFKAAQDGTYILSFEVENAGIHYLHLIDNLTGNDIDLLTTPSYTFEAQRVSMTSRFRLIFDAE